MRDNWGCPLNLIQETPRTGVKYKKSPFVDFKLTHDDNIISFRCEYSFPKDAGGRSTDVQHKYPTGRTTD